MNLVFVCTGNICRSPMAEGMFKKLLEEKGESGIDCSSAGLATFDGRPASDNAQAVALEYGVDISEHKSRMLTRSIARKADLQYETLNRMIPDERLYVLADGVDDPYGCDIEVYRECAKKINGALTELYEKIKSGS